MNPLGNGDRLDERGENYGSGGRRAGVVWLRVSAIVLSVLGVYMTVHLKSMPGSRDPLDSTIGENRIPISKSCIIRIVISCPDPRPCNKKLHESDCAALLVPKTE